MGTLTQRTRPSRRTGATYNTELLPHSSHLSFLSGSMLRQSLCTGCGPLHLSSFWGHLTAVHTRGPKWHGHVTHKSYSCTCSRDAFLQSPTAHTHTVTQALCIHVYLLCQGVDDLPECGEGLVDVGSLLEPCPRCPGGLGPLTACQVHQAQLAHLLCRQSCHRVHPTAAAGVGGAALDVGGAAVGVGGAALGVGGAALGVADD